MTLLLIAAPYGAFALLMLLASATVSLFAAAGVCLVVIALDVWRGRSLKILAVGTAIVFAGLGTYLALVDGPLSNSAVKFLADAGVFIVSLGSMLLRYPFSLQYAREAVSAEVATAPGFVHVNYMITAAWTGAMLVMMLANGAAWAVPGLPVWLGLLVAFTARNGAAFFTKWYPDHLGLNYCSPRASALPASR